MSDRTVDARRGMPLSPAERRALAIREVTESDLEAAGIYGCSVFTMREHLRNARSKLGVQSTGQAIRQHQR